MLLLLTPKAANISKVHAANCGKVHAANRSLKSLEPFEQTKGENSLKVSRNFMGSSEREFAHESALKRG
ncbi:MAG: hypothetical protein WA405_13225 [Candidatus Acidiferrales bacterium]